MEIRIMLEVIEMEKELGNTFIIMIMGTKVLR